MSSEAVNSEEVICMVERLRVARNFSGRVIDEFVLVPDAFEYFSIIERF